jgi:hypothetical protein
MECEVQRRNPVQVIKSGLKKPAGMMPRMVENDPIKRLALCILDQFADRRLHVVRVTNQQNLGTFERSKIPRKISPSCIRLHH